MRTHVLIGALAAFLMVSCEGKTGTEQQSLKVSPEAMTFEAGSGTQRATVTAQGVEWTHEVAAEAAEWLSAERSDDQTLTVTVTENPAPEQRSGRITVSAEGSGVAPCVITVTQQAAEITYGLTVEPASLDFVGVDAPSQQVTVTTEGEGLTWTAEPEEAIAEWVTLAVEGDRITVSVADNPLTTPRTGIITVTPSVESVGAKAIRVTQAGCDPEFSATPLELTFPCGDVSDEYIEQTVQVTARGVEWHIMYSEENISWINAEKRATGESVVQELAIQVLRNAASEPRSVSVYLIPNDEELGFEQIEIKVTQEAAPEYRSNLTEDVVLDVTHAYCYVRPSRPSLSGGTYWQIELLGSDVRNESGNNYGTGDRLYVKLVSTLIEPNDDNEYYLPEGTYTVGTAEEADAIGPWEILYPYDPNDSARYPMGATFTRLENDVWTVKAPLVEGTMEVSRSGDVYTLQLDFKDDQGYSVTGTYEGRLDENRIVN